MAESKREGAAEHDRVDTRVNTSSVSAADRRGRAQSRRERCPIPFTAVRVRGARRGSLPLRGRDGTCRVAVVLVTVPWMSGFAERWTNALFFGRDEP